MSEDAVLPVGTALGAAHFVAGQHVDIQGRTIGKGFQGPMKRWGFSGLPATHGTTKKHRAHGSIGNSQDPGRVFKGKKMAGRMGNRTCTVQCALVYKVDPERNLPWIKGQVPGKAGNFVRVIGECFMRLFKSPADQGLEVPYPAWGMGDMPEAPTEVTVAEMKDPFLQFFNDGGACGARREKRQWARDLCASSCRRGYVSAGCRRVVHSPKIDQLLLPSAEKAQNTRHQS